VKLSNIVRNERPLAVEVETADGFDKINLKYKPSVITPATDAANREEAEGKPFITIVISQLLIIMSGWDLEDEGGIIPLTEEGLRNVPNLLLGTIWEAIIADIGEKKVKKDNNSAGSFAPKA
jgi:hypothetical protein